MSSPQSPQDLKDYHGGELSTCSSASDQDDEYVVDRIIAQYVPDNSGGEEEMYLVRWEGYPDDQCTVSWGSDSHMPFLVGSQSTSPNMG